MTEPTAVEPLTPDLVDRIARLATDDMTRLTAMMTDIVADRAEIARRWEEYKAGGVRTVTVEELATALAAQAATRRTG